MSKFEYRIHPSVGIARMGNSDDMYFVGRETPVDAFAPVPALIPGGNPAKVTAIGNLRDADGKLAKQAARFRIFCYEYDDFIHRDAHPLRVWEVTSSDYDIVWTVQVANLKSWDGSGSIASPNLPNRPPPQNLDSAVPPTLVRFVDPAGGRLILGSAFLDIGGQLLMLGSDGFSRPIPAHSLVSGITTLRWRYWEDDSADGYVRAHVTPRSSSAKPDRLETGKPALEARVVISMPCYGFDTPPSPSLYDVALNHALANNRPGGGFGKPAFHSAPRTYHANIRPFLRAYVQAKYVSTEARVGMRPNSRGHDVQADDVFLNAPATDVSSAMVRMLRPPFKTRDRRAENGFASGPAQHGSEPVYMQQTHGGMPRLNYLAYPELAYQWLHEWNVPGYPAGDPSALSSSVVAMKRAMLLDMAHMGWMSGGSFHPGLEVGREAYEYTRWHADWGADRDHVDIRFDPAVAPGELTKNLSVPWQADFIACTNSWWPMSHPTTVKDDNPAFYEWMDDGTGPIVASPPGGLTDLWWKLGFIRYHAASGEYREQHRLLNHR